MFRVKVGLVMGVVVMLMTGCAPTPRAEVIIPTLAVLPSAYHLEDAERVARDFLDAWQAADYSAMYALTSYTNREAIPYEEFAALYQRTADEMTLERVTITPITIVRDQDTLATFSYDAHFTTRLLGEFADPARDLHLVVDDTDGAWRVAWSAGDIFAAMRDGARVRFDPVVPNRANIYDRDGRVLADQNARVITINLVPQNVPNMQACVNELALALDDDPAEVAERIDSRPANWIIDVGIIEAQTYIDHNEALTNLCDAEFTDRPARRYENGPLTAHIVGYVGYPTVEELPAVEADGFAADTILGRAGIEATWDETLRGQPGGRLVIVEPSGEIVRELTRVSARPGQSVWLTIDSDLQAATQRIIADSYASGLFSSDESRGAVVVVIDVNTGEILAMVSYPSFDNNAYTVFPEMGRDEANRMIERYQNDPRNPELNRATQGVYALGSVMKTVSAAAVADSNVYALDERYTCSGIWSRDIPRYDWFAPGHGTLTLASALTNSCNPYFYEVGYQLSQVDPWILPTYARQLGFGGLTGLPDLPESPGLIGDPDWLQSTYGLPWTYSEEVNMAIGQGYVQVTPLQVARWFAAIANGGSLPRPVLVSQVGLLGDPMRAVYEPEFVPTQLRTDVLDTIRDGLCAVTTASYGTARFVFENSPLQTYGVCGKTGTAQDAPRNSHAWFAAYAPRENPEIAIVAMVENAGQGSEVAAPIARDVLEAYFGLTTP